MRGSLFIKMFTTFWVVTVTVAGSWMLVHNYFDDRPPDIVREHQRPPGPPHRFILRIIYNLQTLEGEALRSSVEDARRRHNVDIFLLDSDGDELLGRDVPEKVVEAASLLRGKRRRAFLDIPGGRISAHEIYRREDGPVRAVFVLRPPAGMILKLLGGSPWLRIGAALAISGLVCYLLSRLMTSRLNELKLASRRLAEGDLDTRLQVRDRGGDETDELARDFNSMAEQLQQRIQAQRRLLGDVSHELRSPLARLRIALALAQQNPADNSAHLQRIEREGERLEKLIAQLLSSQEQAGPLDTHIDLVALLRQLCADGDFEGRSNDKTVALVTALGDAIVLSNGDLLLKCLENVLRNALQHTPPGSEVTVALNREGERYRVDVQDRGPGVPDEDLPHLFDAFYRVDTARSRETGGYGLGLAIARRAVARHGGEISAANTAQGLRISVYLPIPA